MSGSVNRLSRGRPQATSGTLPGGACDPDDRADGVGPLTCPPVVHRTEQLFGCHFVADATIDEVADALLAEIASPPGGWRAVVTPNVDHLVRYDRDPAEADVVRAATTVLPDGMPIVWASRRLGRPLRARLAGSDLFAALWPRLVAAGVATVVVAPSDEVADRLGAEHPQLQAVVPPFFDADDDAQATAVVDSVVDTADAAGAGVVVVALSVAKTHLLAARLHERWADLPAPPIVMLLGAAPEMYLGMQRRAPEWMQRAGLEWLHRLAGDPRRLAKRYLVDDARFLPMVVRERRRLRSGSSRPAEPPSR